VSGLKVDKFIKKSKPTQKLNRTNSVLDYFEYYCKISSKLIVIISSYTVSKLTRFFETQCSYINFILPLFLLIFSWSLFGIIPWSVCLSMSVTLCIVAKRHTSYGKGENM